MFMGFWQVGMVGNSSRIDSPLLSRHLTLQNLRNIIRFVIFSILGRRSKKSQWSPHFPKQSIRGLFDLKPHRKVSATELQLRATNLKKLPNNDQRVFKPWLFAEIWVSKNPRSVPGSPPGGLYFQKWHPKNIFFGNIGQPSKIVIVWQNGFLFFAFCFGPSWPGSLGPWGFEGIRLVSRDA